jgi:hypothetical protein
VDEDEEIKTQRQAISDTLEEMRQYDAESREDPFHVALKQKFPYMANQPPFANQSPPLRPSPPEYDFPDESQYAVDETGDATPYIESANSIVESEAPRIQAFAKLEFDDGQFYMTTYAVELGRDVRAARVAMARDMEASHRSGSIHNGPNSSGGNASQNANRVKPSGSGVVASVVSEKAGIIGIDPEPQPKRRKKSKMSNTKSKSTSSSSQLVQRRNGSTADRGPGTYQTLAMQSLYDQPQPVHAENLMPSPDEVPLIPIHPPAEVEEGSAAFRGISRKHVRIAFNFQKHLFEVEIKGRNGAFVDDQHYAPGTVKSLKSGSYIQIGGVGVRFWLPDVAVGETGAEESEAEASQTTVESQSQDGDSDDVRVQQDSMDEEVDEVQESVEDIPQPGKGKGKSRQKSQPKPHPEQAPLPPPAMPPKKRGPGRPPKDGISSKREKAEQARAAKLAAKKEANGGLTPPPSGKIKLGRARSESNPTEKPEKRKYTKRKKSEMDANGNEEDEVEIEEAPKVKESAPKRERSPSPDYGKESDYTPEQLQKPKESYQYLVYDLLKETPPHQMDLKDIYRGLKKKFPYYVFKVDTPGWQSSVRHNLNQIPVFKKVEKAGKGWLWGIDENMSLPSDRKRRASPPPPLPPPPQSYPNQGPQLLRYPPGPMAPPPLPHQQPLGNGFIPPLAAPPTSSYTSPYQSPYAPPPPPPPPTPPQPPQDHLYIPSNTNNMSQPPQSSPPKARLPPTPAPPIWTTVSHIPESMAAKIKDFRSRISREPGQDITIDSAIDRALGFKKGGEEYMDQAETDLVRITKGLLVAFGWKPEMAEINRGVKRGREDDDREGHEEDTKGNAGEKGQDDDAEEKDE